MGGSDVTHIFYILCIPLRISVYFSQNNIEYQRKF